MARSRTVGPRTRYPLLTRASSSQWSWSRSTTPGSGLCDNFLIPLLSVVVSEAFSHVNVRFQEWTRFARGPIGTRYRYPANGCEVGKRPSVRGSGYSRGVLVSNATDPTQAT